MMDRIKINLALARLEGWEIEPINKYIGGVSYSVKNPKGNYADGWDEAFDTTAGYTDVRSFVYRKEEDIFEHPNPVTGPIPDYYNDLNAIHRLEDLLLDEKRIGKANSLRYLYSNYIYNITPPDCQPFRAKASVRCEALLKTFGCWE